MENSNTDTITQQKKKYDQNNRQKYNQTNKNILTITTQMKENRKSALCYKNDIYEDKILGKICKYKRLIH